MGEKMESVEVEDNKSTKVETVSEKVEEKLVLEVSHESGVERDEVEIKDDGKPCGAVDDFPKVEYPKYGKEFSGIDEDDKTDGAKETCIEEATVKTDIVTEKDEVDDALGKDDKEEKSASDADDDKPSDKLDQEMQSTEVEAEPEPSSKPEGEDDDTTSGVGK